jgi:hypothetical protein
VSDNTKGPTVADLVKMGGGKRLDPEQALILPPPEAILLHNIIMAYPEGLPVLSIDARLTMLCDHKFVTQNAAGKWIPTEAGVAHMRPDLARRARKDKARGLH